MTDELARLIPQELRSRVGALYEEGALWGYLHVRDDEISRRRVLGRGRTARRECVVEELFRILPPAPDAVDAASSLGWSDAYLMPSEIPDEIRRLARNELLLTGKTLRIEWLDGADADAVRAQYFSG